MSTLRDEEPTSDEILYTLLKVARRVLNDDYDHDDAVDIAYSLAWDFIGLHELITERDDIPENWRK